MSRPRFFFYSLLLCCSTKLQMCAIFELFCCLLFERDLSSSVFSFLFFLSFAPTKEGSRYSRSPTTAALSRPIVVREKQLLFRRGTEIVVSAFIRLYHHLDARQYHATGVPREYEHKHGRKQRSKKHAMRTRWTS